MYSHQHVFSIAAVALFLGACDAKQPLVVKDPDVSSPPSLTGPQALQIYRAGAEADFAIAYIGGGDQSNAAHEGIADLGGLFTDELIDIETFATRNALNQRDAQPTNGNLASMLQNIGQAHNDNLRAIGQYQQFGPTEPGHAEMYALDGYLYLFVAEHWCSGEPFSTINVETGAVVNSPFLTTAQMLDTALARFQRASTIAAASDSPSVAHPYAELAQVGTARAQLDLGQVAAAASTAAGLTDNTFSWLVQGSVNSPRQNSGIWFYNVNFPSFGMGDSKNGNGLPFATSGDPRTPATLGAAAGGQPTPFYVSNAYATGGASSATVLSSYTEAQLIVAEGELFAGHYAGALGIMNALRQNSGLKFDTVTVTDSVLPDLSAGTPKQQMQQLLTERAYWFWVTAHRLGDWRRMLRPPYNQAPFNFVIGDVYPMGNGLFDILEFPTPFGTSPNPNHTTCNTANP